MGKKIGESSFSKCPFVSDVQYKMTTTNLKQSDDTILPILHQNPNSVLSTVTESLAEVYISA